MLNPLTAFVQKSSVMIGYPTGRATPQQHIAGGGINPPPAIPVWFLENASPPVSGA